MNAVLAAGVLWIAALQAAPPAAGNAAFVEAVIRSLRDVHDTREIRTTPGMPTREIGLAALRVIRRSSDTITARMEPWKSHSNQRIRDVASYLLRSAGCLKTLGSVYEDVLEGRRKPDQLNARIRLEREALEVMMLSTASVGAGADSGDQLHLEPDLAHTASVIALAGERTDRSVQDLAPLLLFRDGHVRTSRWCRGKRRGPAFRPALAPSPLAD